MFSKTRKTIIVILLLNIPSGKRVGKRIEKIEIKNIKKWKQNKFKEKEKFLFEHNFPLQKIF